MRMNVLSAYAVCICVPCVCLVPVEARGGHQIPWDWNTL